MSTLIMAASNKSNRQRSKGPKAGRRARNKAALEERILNAALVLFQAKGFESTTTKEIARKARIAEGTVFNYFRTKEEIALFFFEREVEQAINAVRQNRRLRRAPLEEKLFALLQSQLEFLEPHQRFIGAAFLEALRPGSQLSFSTQAIALRSRYLSFVQELIGQSRKDRSPRPLDWWAAQAFWIYYIGALLYWLNDNSPGKQNTLAFLDRSLKIAVAVLMRGNI
jgi:AcrR family transcriptional regulator